MKVLTVAAKTLKEAVRQPRILLLTLGLPLAFMVIFGLAFGGSEAADTFAIAVQDQDAGELGATYVANLREVEYDDGRPVFEVVEVRDAAAARRDVERRDVALFLRIPPTFTEDLTPQGGTPPGPLPTQPGSPPQPPAGATIEVLGDPSSPDFQAASQAVAAYNEAFAAEASGRAPLVATQTTQVTSEEFTRFDFIAPGLMVYAVLNLVPQAASALAREVETRTLDRVRLSPLRTSSLLGGVALAQLALAAVGLVLMLVTARLMGFHNQGSYVAAFVITFVAAVAVVGVGMVVAAFARTQQEAANLGVLVSVPASFLSGAFFPVPAVVLATFGDSTVGVYDVLPTTHAVVALRETLAFGHDLASVQGSMFALVLLAIVFFAAGVALFRRKRLAADA